MFIVVRGGWNLEGYRDFEKQFKAAAQPLISNPWGVIVDVREWELSTPDIEAVEKELQLWTLRNNQRWRAFVSEESKLKEEQINRSTKTVSHEIVSRYFQSMEGAREWFNELGLF